MQRLFIPKDQLPIITGADAHYVKNVLRLKPQDQIELLDGTGTIYLAKITEINKDKIACQVLSQTKPAGQDTIFITIAQALPKAQKLDFIVQKTTELGVSQIIPMLTERCVKQTVRIDRLKKIAKEAAEQSGRTTIPEVLPVQSFAAVLKLKPNFDLALLPWEMEKDQPLKAILNTIQQFNNLTILILIGAEGGFSRQEVEQASQAGFSSVSLGQRILRTETVGLALLSIINYVYC